MRSAALAACLATASLAGATAAMAPSTVALRAGATTYVGSTVVTTLTGYGARGSDIVDYRDHAQLRMSVPITNTGRLPLTVTSVDLGGEHLALLSVAGAGLSQRIPAGQTRTLQLDARLGNCRYYHEREVRTYDAVRVRFEVLGRSGEQRVPLVRPMLVHSPMIVGCLDRKLNRQADNRRDY